MLTMLRSLSEYGLWANARLFEAVASLDPAEFLANIDGGYGSIRDTLVHLAGSQWVYRERIQGRSPSAEWNPRDFPDLASIQHHWAPVEAAQQAFLVHLTASALEQRCSYRNFQGDSWTYPLWQLLVHQEIHATQHRSEIAVQLSRLGRSPGWLDFLVYQDRLSDNG